MALGNRYISYESQLMPSGTDRIHGENSCIFTLLSTQHVGKQQISSLGIVLFSLFFFLILLTAKFSPVFSCLVHQLSIFSFSTPSCLSNVVFQSGSVRNVKLWRCFIHARAFIPLSYSHHTCCLLLPAAPGPSGHIWAFSHPALCHRGISRDGAVDQRWPGTGWRKRPPR